MRGISLVCNDNNLKSCPIIFPHHFLLFLDSGIYGPTCQAHRQGCEVGDLNGKFQETIDMAASPDYKLYFYTDDIPLSGAYSVINRAITIHQAQQAAPRYVCADIKRKVLLNM